jgi:hypothetical protein
MTTALRDLQLLFQVQEKTMKKIIFSVFLSLILLLVSCAPKNVSPPSQPLNTPPVSPSPEAPPTMSTATLTPSPTVPPPTPTSTPQGVRRRPAANGLDMQARALSPQVDGELTEWVGFPCASLNQKGNVISGIENWKGASDASLDFCWGWDGSALYLAARVTDDSLFPPDAQSTASKDAIDIHLDVDLQGGFDDPNPAEDNFHLLFLPGNFRDVPSSVSLLAPAMTPEKKKEWEQRISFKAQPESGGYRLEMRLPWDIFRPSLDLQYNLLGAALSLIDSDKDESPVTILSTAIRSAANPDSPIFWNNLDLQAWQAALPSPTPSAGLPTLRALFEHFTPDDHLFMYVDCAPGGKKLDDITGTDLLFDYIIQDRGLNRWDSQKKEWAWNGVIYAQNRNGIMEWDVWWGWMSLCRSDYPAQIVFQRQDKKWAAHYTSAPVSIPSSFYIYHKEPPFVDITYKYPSSNPSTHHFFVYIDSDNNESTGNTTIFPGRGIDYILQDDSLYKWNGSTWVWKALVRVEKTNTYSRWYFSSQSINAPLIDARHPLKMGFSRQDAGWNNLFTSRIHWVDKYVITFIEPPVFDITYNHSAPDKHVFVYMDTDNNASTGKTGLVPGLGVDYVLQDGSLYKYNGSTWDWIVSARTVDTTAQDRWVFSSQFIGNPTLPFKVVFSRQDASWAALYTSPILSLNAYTYTHTEPPPTPTPTPVPTYTFTFHNNYQAGNHFILYLNTDGDSSTGYVAGGGAEYLIQDNGLHQYTGDGSSWSWSGLSCSSLTFSAGSTTTWTLSQACLSALNNGDSVVFQRLDSGWTPLYTSPSVTISSYSASHTEPPPTPTPTPVPTYTFTFTNHYNSGDHLRLYLNTDNNFSTGDWIGGADYLVEWYPDGPSVGMFQWTGTWTWISCPLLSASGTGTAVFSFSASCIGSPSFPFTANYVRIDSGWSIVYKGGPDTISSYSASHTEP